MYIHELGGSWMDNPFWRSAFLLDDPKDMKTILSIKMKSVWIDTAKGIDIDIEAGESLEEVAENIESTLALANIPVKAVERVSIVQEAERAVKICAKSK